MGIVVLYGQFLLTKYIAQARICLLFILVLKNQFLSSDFYKNWEELHCARFLR